MVGLGKSRHLSSRSRLYFLNSLYRSSGSSPRLLAWAQIVAGREHAARAAHDHHADSLVGLRQVERLVDLGQQFVALGVQHLWPVEGDDPEGTFDVECDLPEVADLRRPAIAHPRCLLPCRRSPLASIWLLATVCLGRCSWAAYATMPGNARPRLSGMCAPGECPPLLGQ